MGIDEVQSMSFTEVGKHHQTQSSGLVKKTKIADYGQVYEKLKESSYVFASAIEKSNSFKSSYWWRYKWQAYVTSRGIRKDDHVNNF